VEEFGFGLPSYKLVTLFRWQGTEFTIHALPLGGFVRPKGENDPNVPGGLAAASPWKRLVVLFAGPLMNLFTAIVVFSLLIAMEGVAVSGPIHVQEVSANSPAEQAGFEPGDSIFAMNGQEITGVNQAISIIQANLDQPIPVELTRDNEDLTLTVTPSSSRTREEGAVGISLSPSTRPATAGEIVTGGVTITGYQVATIAYLPVALIQGAIEPSEARVIGFKGIYDLFGIAVTEDVQSRQEAATAPAGASTRPSNWTLNIIAMLSVSLGVMNLLPIPALDGGRILFTLPEILFRKRIPTH
jgi:regulator of sigma E protease